MQSPNSKKSHVSVACVNCKKAHLACDNQRPCKRCALTDKADTCVDLKHKKRGRPPLSRKLLKSIHFNSDLPSLTASSDSSGGESVQSGQVAQTAESVQDPIDRPFDPTCRQIFHPASKIDQSGFTSSIRIEHPIASPYAPLSPSVNSDVSSSKSQSIEDYETAFAAEPQSNYKNKEILPDFTFDSPATPIRQAPTTSDAHELDDIHHILVDIERLLITSVAKGHALGLNSFDLAGKLTLYDLVHEFDKLNLYRFHHDLLRKRFNPLLNNVSSISLHFRTSHSSNYKLFRILPSDSTFYLSSSASQIRYPNSQHVSYHPGTTVTISFYPFEHPVIARPTSMVGLSPVAAASSYRSFPYSAIL